MWGFHALAVALTTLTTAIASGQAPLSISVSGNHFVNQNGQTVRLLGVDHQGTEYACEQGWGYTEGAYDTNPAADQTAAVADAAAIAAWNANAVRVPLNEDCWLGINGQPSFGTQAGYQQYIEDWVSDLNADGLYVILDLHWSAPGTTVASGQWPMADQHSVDFWASVASAFKDNHAVVFDAFNEPFSPAATYYGDAHATALTWSCWLSGGCTLPNSVDGDAPTSSTPTYQNAGMQAIVNAIRTTGASQPILLGGLSYANDLSGWLAHEPTDPDSQLAASLHAYEGNACADVGCFNLQVAPVAAKVPVVISEFDEDPCAGTGDAYDENLMNWADGEGVSYLAWGWIAGAAPDCNDYYLNDASNNPVAPNGTLLKDHLGTVSAVSGSGSGSGSGSSSSSGSSSAPNSVSGTQTTPVSGSTSASGSTTHSPAGTTDTTSSTVSATAHACAVPDVIGQTLARARRRLQRAGCRLGRVVFRKLTRSSAASGRRSKVNAVISETPAPGRQAPAGTRVTLVIGER